MTTPFFSIVIPTLNEEKYLPKLLTDLSDQTFKEFEVLVVDGHSDDATIIEAKKFSPHLKIKTFVVDKRSVSFQRNFGAKKSRGQWIIFMDSDNRLFPQYLREVSEELKKDPDVGIFTTWVAPEKNDQMYQAIANGTNFSIELCNYINRPTSFGALIGANQKVLKTIQFDERQKVYEDGKFVQAAIRGGFNFKIFRKPKFIFSLRRVRKEGSIKMLAKSLMINIHFLRNKSFEDHDFGYYMEGGGAYDLPNDSVFDTIHNHLLHASKKQLQAARKLLNSLKELQPL